MKRCPECRRDYTDDTLSFCLDDGASLLDGPASDTRSEPGAIATGLNDGIEPATAIQSEPGAIATGLNNDVEPATSILSEPGAIATGFRGSEDQTRPKIDTTDQTATFQTGAEAVPLKALGDETESLSRSSLRAAKPHRLDKRLLVIPFLFAFIVIGGFLGYQYFASNTKQIESIAVMPFENKGTDADSDYLSEGVTESLIYRLSQLPDLKVSPTSSVFRYKGKAIDPLVVAKELDVDSVLTGRILQRGDSISISVNLVDARDGASLWGEKYERKMTELLATQTQITTEITNNLRLKLSGESEQKLAKNIPTTTRLTNSI